MKMNLRYFVLGLLAQQPMSGYDIQRFLKGLAWLINRPSSGSLYPLLRSLLEEGQVTVEVIPGLDRPPRKIYSITPAGRESLQAWVDRPVEADGSLKAFVMQLFLAECLPGPRLVDQLRQRQAQVATHREGLLQTIAAAGAQMALGQRLALEYGLALSDAELVWLESELDRLLIPLPPG
jgi:DNA-binding PadR family transcriptional regulator